MAERRGMAGPWLVRGTLTAAVFLGGVLWMALSAGSPASAKSKFLPGFAEAYPEAAASALNGCLLCHTSPNPSGDNKARNPYGDDWDEEGDEDYLAIDDLDSDGDGFSNRVEIEALSFPGDPSSTPLTVTTTTTQPGTPPDGKGLYDTSCAACHGAGGGNLIDTALTESQFIDVVANGQGASMPAFGGSLSSADIAAIYAYVTGAPPPPPPTTTTTAPGTPPQPIDAAALFNSTCAGCHGSDGGNLVPTSLTSSRLVSVITNGQGPMPGYGSSLSSAQIQALATYLIDQSTSPAPTTTTTTAPGTRPRSGAAVWSASCAGCHGAAGGNVAGTTLSRSQLISVISNGVGSMPGFKSQLPVAEIEAVADYLRSVAATTTTTAPGAEPDGANLYMQNCAICHGPHGEGGSGGAIAGSALGRATLEDIIVNGTGSMPGFSSKLGAAELTALIDHAVGIVGSPAPGSDEKASQSEVDLAATTSEERESTTTTELAAVGSAGDGDVTASAGLLLPAIEVPEEPDADRSGSPWLPVVPVLAAAGWVVTGAVRTGQLVLPGRR